jgi:hypothetical protein
MRRLPALLSLLIAFAWVLLGAMTPLRAQEPTCKPPDQAAGFQQGDLSAKPKGNTESIEPVRARVSVMLHALNKFELAQGAYHAEFAIVVRCSKEPCNTDIDVVNGELIGAPEKVRDEKLVKIFKMKAELNSIMDFSEFPFDRHVLPIILEDRQNPSGVTFELDQEHNGVDADLRLAGWNVVKHAAEVVQRDMGEGLNVSQVRYGVLIERPQVAAITKTLLPLGLLLLVSGITLLVRPKNATARWMAAIGALLAVVVLHLSSSLSLPPTSCLTRMDKLVIASYLVCLVNIAFAMLLLRFEDKKNERGSELTYLVALGTVPGVALVSWLPILLRLV